MGFFDKIKAGLTKTREALSGTLGSVFSGFSEIDDDFYDELEESLILADLGVDTSVKAVGRLRKAVREQHLKTTEEAREALKEILVDMLSVGDTELNLSTHPSVILVIGVNGVGKTTTIGKIAKQLTSQGKKVMLVAGDTFRAAAADQLEIWAGRSGASIVRQHEGADPASVVFDGIQSAKARDVDVILIDTAGRLHNKQNLMNELAKLRKIIDRECPDSSCETLLVLDATTGQNGLMLAAAVTLLLVPSRVLACLLSRLVPLRDEEPTPEQLQKKLLPRALLYAASAAVVYLAAYPILNFVFGTGLLNLGIYLPMLVVEPLLTYRFGRVQETVHKAVSKGVRITVGYALLLLVVGVVREWLSLGTVFGAPVGRWALLPLAKMPAGGFIVLGILCAIWRAAAAKRKEYLKKEARDTLTVHYQKEGNREP